MGSGIRYHLRELTRFAPVRPAIGSGIRAAVATVVPLFVAELLGVGALAAFASLGGHFTAIQDKGGAYDHRARAMGAVACFGSLAVLLAGFLPLSVGISLLAPLVLISGLVRVYGAAASGAGLAVVILYVVALTRSSVGPADALDHAAATVAGAAWALLLSLLLWPVRIYAPARRSVAEVWRQIAEHLRALASGEQATRGRLQIRIRLEEARRVVSATRRGRQAEDPRGERLVVLIELAEQGLGELVTLADLLEVSRPPEVAESLRHLAQSCERIATLVARPGEVPGPPVPEEIEGSAEAPGPRRLVASSLFRLRHFGELGWDAARELSRAQPARLGVPRENVSEKRPLLAPLLESIDPHSEVMQHALRAAVTALAAALLATAIDVVRGEWVILTAIVILQPHTSTTWTRGLQRVVGTAVGSLFAALLAAQLQDFRLILLAVFLFTAVSISLLPINYGIFSALLTPALVLLAQIGTGGESLAAYRAIDTLLGALLAWLAILVLWPTRERQRLPEELGRVLLTSAAFLRAAASGADRLALDDARREVGLALINADASFQRFLSESSGDPDRVSPHLTLLTYARRLHGSTVSLIYAAGIDAEREALREFFARVASALDVEAARLLRGTKRKALADVGFGETRWGWQLERVELQLQVLRRAVDRIVST